MPIRGSTVMTAVADFALDARCADEQEEVGVKYSA